jgi:hypothetical protein
MKGGPHSIRAPHTVGDDTRRYALDPEASKAANFEDFSTGTFINGLEAFGGDGGGEASADSTMGSVGIGGGVTGEIPDIGAFVAPMFRFRCISNSPTYQRAIHNQFSKKIMQ